VSKKTAVMTEKERVEALLNGKKPDRVPIWPFALNGFATIYNKLSITDAYTNPEASYQSQLKACIDFGFHMNITNFNDRVAAEIPSLIEKGITTLKVFTA